MPWTQSMAHGPALGWPVHGSTMDYPRGRRQGLTRARPSGCSGPRWLATRVETGQARCGATEGLLTGAQLTARRRRTNSGASVPSGHGAGAIEEGRRRGEGVRCFTGVWGSFYRVRTEAGAAGNRGQRQ
jgi:hypothetical protein